MSVYLSVHVFAYLLNLITVCDHFGIAVSVYLSVHVFAYLLNLITVCDHFGMVVDHHGPEYPVKKKS